MPTCGGGMEIFMKKRTAIILCIVFVVFSLALSFFAQSTPPKEADVLKSANSIVNETQKDVEIEKDISVNTSNKNDNEIKNDEVKTPDAIENTVQKEEKEQSQIDSTCTLSVRCDTILKNIDNLKPEKIDLVPQNGIIYYSQNVVFYEGESAFNVLSRELKQNRIHFEFSISPIYKTAYIEGIANLYEFDCGELSGWIYKINGETLNMGCSLYEVKEGDVIEFLYTCNMGNDVK